MRGLAAGKIRPVQRTGKKFFIYPDASRNRIYVGGPKEYEAYLQLHPEHRPVDAEQAAREAGAYRGKRMTSCGRRPLAICPTPSGSELGRSRLVGFRGIVCRRVSLSVR